MKRIKRLTGLWLGILSLSLSVGTSYVLAMTLPDENKSEELIPAPEGRGPAFSSGGQVKKGEGPEYAPGEILLGLKEGVKIDELLKGAGIEPKALGRIHDIKPVVEKFKKTHKLEKDSSGRYLFSGKNYKEVADIPEEALFQEAYKGMHENEKKLYRSHKLRLSKGVAVEGVVARLKNDPHVEYAEPNYLAKIQMTPNDPLYLQQWAHQKTQAELGWDIQRGEPSIIIAIVDTGVDYNHEDLAANIWRENSTGNPGKDFVDIDTAAYISDGYGLVAGEDYTQIDNDPSDYYGHGTHCAGIAGAVGDNSTGVAGVCHNCKIMPVRAGFSIIDPRYGEVGSLEYDDIANAITYAADNGAKVISMSFGGDPSRTLWEAINYAHDNKGVTLVAAAGNGNTSTRSYPAAYDNVIAVGATAQDDTKSFYSNYGEWIDVAAPGGDSRKDSMILSSVPKIGTLSSPSGYKFLQGTSMACPYVAGLAGLILSSHPEFSNEDIKNTLLISADHIEDSLGFGRVNIYKAVKQNPSIFLYLVDFNAVDPNDSIMNPGDTAELYLNIANLWLDAQNVQVEISSVDPLITVIEGSEMFGSMPGGTNRSNTLPFRFKIASEGVEEFHPLNLKVKITASPDFEKVVDISVGDVIVPAPYPMPAYQAGWPVEMSNSFPSFYSVLSMADVDHSGKKELAFGMSDKIHILDSQGNELPGYWPQDSYDGVGPTLGDIDLNKDLEVFTSKAGGLLAFYHNGSTIPGLQKSVITPFNLERVFSAIADINNDGKPELIGVEDNGFVSKSYEGSKVYVWDAEGNLLPGWPVPGPSAPGSPDLGGGNQTLWLSPPALADLDGDGTLEIIVYGSNSWRGQTPGAFAQLIAWHYDGSLVSGFPQTTYDKFLDFFYFCQPVTGDLDGDRKDEIIMVELQNDNGIPDSERNLLVYVFRGDGTISPGWPKQLEGIHQSDVNLALGDLDDDELPEVVVATGGDSGVLETRPYNARIYVWDKNGDSLQGWPKIIEGYHLLCGPVVADIDGDNKIDILCPVLRQIWDNVSYHPGTTRVFVWNNKGLPLKGFPFDLPDGQGVFYNAGVVDDFDGDESIELALLTQKGDQQVTTLHIFDLPYKYNPYGMEWPMGNHDIQRTNRYTLPPDVTPPTTPVVTDGGTYTTLTAMIGAKWSSADPESGIVEYQYKITQDSKTGSVIRDWTSNGTNNSIMAVGLSLISGKTYYFAVKARNGAGLWSAVGYSDGITSEQTPPTTPVVTDGGTYTTLAAMIGAKWVSSDHESGIVEYQYKITQDSKTGSVIRDWTSSGTTNSVMAVGLNLISGKTYYFAVKARNGAGLWSAVGYSDGITHDKAPTISGIADSPDPFDPEAGQSSKISYTLGDDLSSSLGVYVYMYNSAGTLVRTLGKYTQSLGNNYVNWDGKNSSAVYAPDGTYKYQIKAIDKVGNTFIKTGYYVTKK